MKSSIRIVSEDEFRSAAFQKFWDEVFSQGISYDYGQMYRYNLLWWEMFSNKVTRKELLLMTCITEDATSIWPLMLRKRKGLTGIHLIAGVDALTTSHRFPLITDNSQFALHLNEIIRYLHSNETNWDFFRMHLPSWTGLVPVLAESKQQTIGGLPFWREQSDQCYSAVCLPEDFESYLSNVGPNTRSAIKRYMRIIGEHDFDFQLLRGETLVAGLDEMIRLNAGVWEFLRGEENENAQFLKRFVQENAELHKDKLILPTLTCSGEVIASVLCFLYKDRCVTHIAGVKRDRVHALSPGITLYGLLIRKLCGTDVKYLDFGSGAYPYKQRLNARLESYDQVVIFNSNFSRFIYLSGIRIKEVTLGLKRLIKRKVKDAEGQ